MRGSKFTEEASVILREHSQVLYLIFKIGYALNTHTQCESRIFLGVYAASIEHIRIDHAASENLNPTGVLAERAAFAAAEVTGYIHFG